MPLGTAVGEARAGRRLSIAAMAAAMQGVFYWLLVHVAVRPPVPPTATPLQVTIIQAARRAKPLMLPRKNERRPAPRHRSEPREPPAPPLVRPITQTPQSAPRAPIDWRQALRAEVRSLQSPPERMSFGFPRQPPPASAAPPQFGWDQARTHRVESLPDGGMLINLNDQCAIVLYVLPIPVCKIGSIPANGGLFDHLHDPRAAGRDRLP